MASDPIVNRIRIIPRPDGFLDRNVGSSGEVFYDKQANTLRLYDGKLAGGYTLLTSGNLSQQLSASGVAVLEKTVTVGVDTVASQGSGVFYIDGVEKPQLNLVRGYTYVFDQSDATNENYASLYHPLMFSTVENGELAGGGHYNTGVVYLLDDDPVTMAKYVSGFQAATTRKVLLTVQTSTPNSLFYWCHFHLNQGNSITVADPGTGSGSGGGGGSASVEVSDTVPATPTSGNIWFNSSSGRLYVYAGDTDSNQWVQPTVPVFPTFKTVAIKDSDSATIVASSVADTLTFEQGTGIDLQINSATNTLTITSASSSSVGNFSFASSIIDTDDSSSIIITPSVTVSSDLTVENDLVVNNTLSAKQFINTSIGAPILDSASTLSFVAPDGVLIRGELKLENNNITGVGTINNEPTPFIMGVLDGSTNAWSGGGVSGIVDNAVGDHTLTFTSNLGTTVDDFQVLATVQDKTAGHSCVISKPAVNQIRVNVDNLSGTGVDSKVFLVIYKTA